MGPTKCNDLCLLAPCGDSAVAAALNESCVGLLSGAEKNMQKPNLISKPIL